MPPQQLRILRQEYWEIEPEEKEWMLKGLTTTDIDVLKTIVELMVKRLEKFKEHFAGSEDNYFIIGGTACDIALRNTGMRIYTKV